MDGASAMTHDPTEQDLNAYIDGELSPEDSARVARAIAQDKSLAAQVASLTRVKSALSALNDELPRTVALPDPHRAVRWLGTAAALGLLIAAGIVLMITLAVLGRHDDRWYQQAVAEHSNWAREPALSNAREVDANLFLASVERFALPVQTPDLTSAGLRLTYLRYTAPTETLTEALHLGYTGRHGCKLTLWVSPAPPGLSTALIESRFNNLRGFRWRSGETAYALFATGMAEKRFTVIARKVHQATLNHQGFDEKTRVALKNASSTAPPCRA